MSKKQEQKEVDEWFYEYGHQTAIKIDTGYGSTHYMTINELYDMFRLRMKLENEE